MAERSKTNEIYRLQSEVSNEIARDAPEIAEGIFGSARDQPDIVSVPNERMDAMYRDAYLRDDRTFLQKEARRDPEQFLKVAQRIGVKATQVAPGAQSPVPKPNAFANAAAQPPALPPPPTMAPPPMAAPPLPVAVPAPVAVPRPVILGPNGMPLNQGV